jgi:hypothetical protein
MKNFENGTERIKIEKGTEVGTNIKKISNEIRSTDSLVGKGQKVVWIFEIVSPEREKQYEINFEAQALDAENLVNAVWIDA